jgi:hypothetical protein
MPTLHLGVLDVGYVQTESAPKRAPKRPRKGPHKAHAKKYQNISTGDVAEILESKYHPMEIFFEQHKEDIAADLEGSLAGALESLLMGAPPSLDAFGSATSQIEDRFKKFLSEKEMEGLGYPGVPTKAALMGVSHRFLHPYKKRPPRPSFIDTGLYQASFKSWVD